MADTDSFCLTFTHDRAGLRVRRTAHLRATAPAASQPRPQHSGGFAPPTADRNGGQHLQILFTFRHGQPRLSTRVQILLVAVCVARR